MNYVIRLLLLWLLCLFSVFLHETGHALGYWIAAGKQKWKVIAGSGPKIVSIGRYTFCLIPVGGYFIPEEEEKTKKEKLMILSGGPLGSLLLTVLFGVLRLCFFGTDQTGSALYDILFPVSNFLLLFNFFQFLFTAIPMRYRIVCRGQESDGLQMIHVLKHEKL